MSARAERLARVRSTVDRRHGETISVTPMSGGGNYGAPRPDATRAPFDVVGYLMVAGDQQIGASTKSSLQVSDCEAAAFVDPQAWPQVQSLREGDVLVGDDHPGSVFHVERLGRHQMGRLVIHLSVKEAAP